jgi:hypothetical protein
MRAPRSVEVNKDDFVSLNIFIEILIRQSKNILFYLDVVLCVKTTVLPGMVMFLTQVFQRLRLQSTLANNEQRVDNHQELHQIKRIVDILY